MFEQKRYEYDINKEELLDDILTIAYTHPAQTILIKMYTWSGLRMVYASDYFIREVEEIWNKHAISKVTVNVVEWVVEGAWRVTDTKEYLARQNTPTYPPTSGS